ncbi:hypothetical protein F5B20DRAFT_497341 [Whalleya microplaca]|nr:hypothetical protein F5B20DRAFT_497341 [Whalleya microplaca]
MKCHCTWAPPEGDAATPHKRVRVSLLQKLNAPRPRALFSRLQSRLDPRALSKRAHQRSSNRNKSTRLRIEQQITSLRSIASYTVAKVESLLNSARSGTFTSSHNFEDIRHPPLNKEESLLSSCRPESHIGEHASWKNPPMQTEAVSNFYRISIRDKRRSSSLYSSDTKLAGIATLHDGPDSHTFRGVGPKAHEHQQDRRDTYEIRKEHYILASVNEPTGHPASIPASMYRCRLPCQLVMDSPVGSREQFSDFGRFLEQANLDDISIQEQIWKNRARGLGNRAGLVLQHDVTAKTSYQPSPSMNCSARRQQRRRGWASDRPRQETAISRPSRTTRLDDNADCSSELLRNTQKQQECTDFIKTPNTEPIKFNLKHYGTLKEENCMPRRHPGSATLYPIAEYVKPAGTQNVYREPHFGASRLTSHIVMNRY